MALIQCPECGKEISNQALACPNCGNPIKPQIQQPVRRAAAYSNQPEKSNNYGVGLIVYLVLIVVGAVMRTSGENYLSPVYLIGTTLFLSGSFMLFILIIQVILALLRKL